MASSHDGEGVMSDCTGARFHTFDVPVAGSPYARQCRDCGESQRYKAPTGGGRDPFVIVDERDLRELIDAYRGQAAMPDEGAEALCDRLELLLTPR